MKNSEKLYVHIAIILPVILLFLPAIFSFSLAWALFILKSFATLIIAYILTLSLYYTKPEPEKNLIENLFTATWKFIGIFMLLSLTKNLIILYFFEGGEGAINGNNAFTGDNFIVSSPEKHLSYASFFWVTFIFTVLSLIYASIIKGIYSLSRTLKRKKPDNSKE